MSLLTEFYYYFHNITSYYSTVQSFSSLFCWFIAINTQGYVMRVDIISNRKSSYYYEIVHHFVNYVKFYNSLAKYGVGSRPKQDQKLFTRIVWIRVYLEMRQFGIHWLRLLGITSIQTIMWVVGFRHCQALWDGSFSFCH